MVRKAQRIPFKPSKTQARLLEECFGARRFVWNQCVEAFNSYDKDTNPKPATPSIGALKDAHEWLASSPVPSNALSQTLMDFAKARRMYFTKGEWARNRPRFASKHDLVQSFRNGMPIRRMETHNRYPLSRKLGSVRIPKRKPIRYPLDNLTSWTVKREHDKYVLVLLFEVEPEPLPATGKTVGIDLGIKDFAVLSDGHKIDLPEQLDRLEQRIRREQRTLSRRHNGKKGTRQSNNYYKQKQRLQWACKRKHDYMDNWQHHISKTLVDENQVIGVEDLNVAGMSRKARKRMQPDGTTRRKGPRKRHMNRRIRQSAWASFTRKLEYKSQWAGRMLVRVNRFYPSSQLCHECGYRNRSLTLKDRQWTCPACGHDLDRDVNAARNILAEALRNLQ